MSDASTDAAKLQRRWEEFERHLCAIKDYILFPDQYHHKQAVAVAAEIDDREGTRFADGLGMELTRLMVADEPIRRAAWARLLLKAHQSIYFEPLKELSPFRLKMIVFVDRDAGLVHFFGNIKAYFDKIIVEKPQRVFGSNKLIMVLPSPNPDDVEIF